MSAGRDGEGQGNAGDERWLDKNGGKCFNNPS